MTRLFNFFVCILILILIGCANNPEAFPTEIPNIPSPSIVVSKTVSPTPRSTNTPSPTVGSLTSDINLANTTSMVIYSDAFNPDWELIKTKDIETNLEAKTYRHGGVQSIAITPKIGLSRTSIIVKEDTSYVYPRDNILGFRFWINPANGYIKPSHLMVSVIGSNAYHYYVDGDDSVKNSNDPAFQETPLDFLGYDQVMSPETWVEVVVLLDDLINKQDYEYIVGFYFKYDEGFLQTFYIDDIQLIIEGGESIPQKPTSTFTITPTLTPTSTATSTPNRITPYHTPTLTETRKPKEPRPTKEPTLAPGP